MHLEGGRGWGLGRRAYCGHAGVAPIALRERWGQCRPGPRDPFCYPSVSLSRGVEPPPPYAGIPHHCTAPKMSPNPANMEMVGFGPETNQRSMPARQHPNINQLEQTAAEPPKTIRQQTASLKRTAQIKLACGGHTAGAGGERCYFSGVDKGVKGSCPNY